MTDIPGVQQGPAQLRTRRRVKQQRRCPQCGRNFFKAEHLARHIRSHTKERPFGCSLCGKAYSRQDSLLRHARTHLNVDGEPLPPESTAVMSPSGSQLGETLAHTGTVQDSSLPSDSTQAYNNIPTVTTTAPTTEPSASASAATERYAVSSSRQETTAETDSNFPQNPIAIADSGIVPTPRGAGSTGAAPSSWNASTSFGYLDVESDPNNSAWLFERGFDVDEIDIYTLEALSDWIPRDAAESLWQHPTPVTLDHPNPLSPFLESVTPVQQCWHTRVPRDITSRSSVVQLADQESIDERYREDLLHRLQPCMSDTTLPSSDFLNLCLKLYFEKFNPIFPIIHAPTFRPSSQNTLLLLSICSVGAVFVGTSSAALQGRRIFQMLNKSNLASWENYLHQGGREALSLVQASIIGQTFGILSGQPQDLCMTESFHGTVIAWARQAGLFKVRDSLSMVDKDSSFTPEKTWRLWAQVEESIRLVLGLHVHDTEFATSFHHGPILRPIVEKLPVCCSEELFTASSYAQWHNLIRSGRGSEPANASSFHDRSSVSQSPHRVSQMYLYASLAGILSCIYEEKTSFLSDATVQNFRSRLLVWYDDSRKVLEESKNDPINLVTLWHTAFICLYGDFDLLERALGRDGNLVAEQVSCKVRAWAPSSEARRGVLHAFLVLEQLEALSMGAEPAIHVPKALFYSAIIIYCYKNFGPAVSSFTPSQDEINAPELQVLGPATSLRHSSSRLCPMALPSVNSSALCRVINLLRRVGHWGISLKYASILERLLDNSVGS